MEARFPPPPHPHSDPVISGDTDCDWSFHLGIPALSYTPWAAKTFSDLVVPCCNSIQPLPPRTPPLSPQHLCLSPAPSLPPKPGLEVPQGLPYKLSFDVTKKVGQKANTGATGRPLEGRSSSRVRRKANRSSSRLSLAQGENESYGIGSQGGCG